MKVTLICSRCGDHAAEPPTEVRDVFLVNDEARRAGVLGALVVAIDDLPEGWHHISGPSVPSEFICPDCGRV